MARGATRNTRVMARGATRSTRDVARRVTRSTRVKIKILYSDTLMIVGWGRQAISLSVNESSRISSRRRVTGDTNRLRQAAGDTDWRMDDFGLNGHPAWLSELGVEVWEEGRRSLGIGDFMGPDRSVSLYSCGTHVAYRK